MISLSPRSGSAIASVLCGLPIVLLLSTTLRTSEPAASHRADQSARFSYSAQVTCGFDPPAALSRILPGQYATSILIHNPGERSTHVTMRLSLSFPDANGGSDLLAGPVSEVMTESLEGGAAFQLDCGEHLHRCHHHQLL